MALVALAIVSARLDYCDGLQYGTTASNSDHLRVAQVASARMLEKMLGTVDVERC
jgi:hypothetical protein